MEPVFWSLKLTQRRHLSQMYMQVQRLSHYSTDILSCLVEYGIACAQTNEFGAREAALQIPALQWKSLVRLRQPQLEVVIVDSPRQYAATLPKLDLIAILHREGFDAVSDREIPRAWTREAAMVYRRQAVPVHSKMYFACLVVRESILEKGARQILHNMPASYYKALLCLRKLDLVQALEDEGRLTVAKCNELLKDKSVEKLSIDLDDEAPAPAAILAIEDAPSFEQQLPLMIGARDAERALLQPFTLPPIAGAPRQEAVVNFDNCSHASGIMRGYSRCVWHDRCSKWQQLNVSGSRERLIAYLYAWQIAGGENGMSQEMHVSQFFAPQDTEVDACMRRLFPGM